MKSLTQLFIIILIIFGIIIGISGLVEERQKQVQETKKSFLECKNWVDPQNNNPLAIQWCIEKFYNIDLPQP